ncbi:MAG: hypothetical protein AB7E80_03370 [Hyphomicrobiaceae bacterium]
MSLALNRTTISMIAIAAAVLVQPATSARGATAAPAGPAAIGGAPGNVVTYVQAKRAVRNSRGGQSRGGGGCTTQVVRKNNCTWLQTLCSGRLAGLKKLSCP